MARLSPLLTLTLLLTACGRAEHGRVASFVRPPTPAGFAEHAGTGWRAATPSTWQVRTEPLAAWAAVDPQPVSDFHANANVVVEPFRGISYDYAKATAAALRRDSRSTVEATREDVIDGDPTVIVEARWSPIPPSTVAYRTMQANLASRGNGYVLTCSVSAEAFERYRSTCDAMIRSFAVER